MDCECKFGEILHNFESIFHFFITILWRKRYIFGTSEGEIYLYKENQQPERKHLKKRWISDLLDGWVFGKNSIFCGEGSVGSGSLQEINNEGVVTTFPISHEVNSLVEWRGYLVSGCRAKGEGWSWSGNITVWDTKSRSIVTQWNTESPVCSLLSLKKKIINGEEDDYLCSGHIDGIINIWNSKGSLIRQLKGHT